MNLPGSANGERTLRYGQLKRQGANALVESRDHVFRTLQPRCVPFRYFRPSSIMGARVPVLQWVIVRLTGQFGTARAWEPSNLRRATRSR
jgi:hypothetical protein